MLGRLFLAVLVYKKVIATSLQKNEISICTPINIFLLCNSYFNRGIK